MASWSVVTTLKEPLDVVLRFVSYYLELGADHIFVYFDDHDDPAYEVIKDHPQVTATLRPQGFWDGKYSGHIRFRHLSVQNYNALETYEDLKTDWMTFVDGDEYMYSPHNISELLDERSGDIVVARSSEPSFVNEATWGVPLITHSRVIGETLDIFASVKAETDFKGIVGHSAGKSFMRRGQNVERMKVHRPDITDAKVEAVGEDQLTLVHYLNFGAKAWAKKLAGRIENGRYKVKPALIEKTPKDFKSREQAWQEAYGRGGVEGLVDFFRHHKVFSDEVVSLLAMNAHLSEFQFDFSKAMATHFGVTDFEGQNETSIFSLD